MNRKPDIIRTIVLIFAVGLVITGFTSMQLPDGGFSAAASTVAASTAVSSSAVSSSVVSSTALSSTVASSTAVSNSVVSNAVVSKVAPTDESRRN